MTQPLDVGNLVLSQKLIKRSKPCILSAASTQFIDVWCTICAGMTCTALATTCMCLQEENQVMAQYLVEDSSWEALIPKIQQLDQRLRALGLPTPWAVYLDNTAAGENSIRMALPSVQEVKEDHYHATKRFTSQLPDDLPEKRKLMFCCSSVQLYVTAHRATICIAADIRKYCCSPRSLLYLSSYQSLRDGL